MTRTEALAALDDAGLLAGAAYVAAFSGPVDPSSELATRAARVLMARDPDLRESEARVLALRALGPVLRGGAG